MTRVSLKEAYDNKDVVAQIYAIRDTAESAEDSAEQAVTTANTASEHVDALVPQVEGAVENANSASASAQASAQTVAGYDNRLTAVEGGLDAVTLRVQTAEGDIVTIQGRVTAIESNYLKKSGDPQTVVSEINVPTTTTGARDTQIANGTRIQNDLDAYAPMVRTTGNQTKTGILTFKSDAQVNLYLQSDTATINTESGLFPRIGWFDKNGVEIAKLLVVTRANGTTALAVTTRNSNGTQTTTILSEGSVI